jgi:quercetin dioxygenase-like cupin family protein
VAAHDGHFRLYKQDGDVFIRTGSEHHRENRSLLTFSIWRHPVKHFADFKTMPGKSPLAGFIFKEAHLDNVMLTWVEMEPGSILPEHHHPHEQISMVVKGALELTVAGTTRVMRQGDVAVVPSNVVHSGKVMDEPTVAVDAWNPIRDDYINR